MNSIWCPPNLFLSNPQQITKITKGTAVLSTFSVLPTWVFSCFKPSDLDVSALGRSVSGVGRVTFFAEISRCLAVGVDPASGSSDFVWAYGVVPEGKLVQVNDSG